MYVMRDKKTHKPLALSFSVEGLQFTTDERGRYIYFKKAHPVIKNGKLQFHGDLRMSDSVYVEIYQKRVDIDKKYKKIERMMALKAKQYGR